MSGLNKAGMKFKPCSVEQGQAVIALFLNAQDFESGSFGRIGSVPIAALLTSIDGGNADDCREQSRSPSLAVGRIGFLPICDTSAVPGSRKGIDNGTVICGKIALAAFYQIVQYIAKSH